MSEGYTPLFNSITTGTLCGKWPDIGLWAIVLSQSDKRGVLDVTPDYLALVTGLPVGEVVACMERFCQPDPRSRTKTHDGARLELIDPTRDWGWRVVNHTKYREKARLMGKDAERTASGRDAERKRQEREKDSIPLSPPASPEVPLSDADADACKRQNKPTRSARGSRLPVGFKPDLEYASSQILDIDADGEAQRFVDYWNGKAGAAAVKTDWPATWRNWIRNCKDSGKYARRQAKSGGIHAGVVMR